MDVEQFLVKQGWKKGQGLRPGAIKNALLVKHRKDNKGLGFNPQASEGWWERMFNGHLQSLGVSKQGEFKFDEEKRRRETSPLYASFYSGGLLQGTQPSRVIKKTEKRRDKKRRDEKRKSERKSEKKSKSERKKQKKLANKSEKKEKK